MAQTSVTDVMTIGFPGMLSDSSRTKDVASKTSEEASAEIPFGVMVKQGTEDDGVLLLTSIADLLVGVVLHSDEYLKDLQLGDDGLKPGTTMGVLVAGRCLVRVEDAVTPASGVFVRAVAAGAEVAGAFRGTADSTDCINITDYAKFRESAGAGEVVELEFNMITSRAVDAVV